MRGREMFRTIAVVLGIVVSLGIIACGGSGVNTVTGPNAVVTSTPTATPTSSDPTATPTTDDGGGKTPAPTAAPTSTVPPPTPTTAPGAPTVNITTSGSSCHPKKDPNSGAVTPCNITFTANVTGGATPFTYAWTGICSGTAKTATGGVNALGPNYCTVEVTDGLARKVTANSDPVTGTNTAPTCGASATGATSCHPSGSSPYTCSLGVTGSGSDADGDTVKITWSGVASGTGASGTAAVNKIGANTATATCSDGWATASANVGLTGTDTALAENWGIGPTYNAGAQTETKFQWNDGDNDAIETCEASCTDSLGLGCCTIVNCRTDTYAGANGHVIYKQATTGPGGAQCSMHLHVCTHWSCFNDNAGFTP